MPCWRRVRGWLYEYRRQRFQRKVRALAAAYRQGAHHSVSDEQVAEAVREELLRQEGRRYGRDLCFCQEPEYEPGDIAKPGEW